MTSDVPPQIRDLVELQRGLLTAAQATAVGLTRELLKSRVRQGRWQRIHRGVYATFSGRLSREAVMWAAVLSAGESAVLSHKSAAELDKLTDEPSELTHVTIPRERRIANPGGVVIHRSARAILAAHPTLIPHRTRVEETILDLVDAAVSLDDAVGWITRGLGRRLTTVGKLRQAAEQRAAIRWRRDLTELLSEDMRGVHSSLEYRYVRDVERPHGLPRGLRQARFEQEGRSRYRDVFYEEYAVVVELDGQLAHPPEDRWRDIRRDNAAAASGKTTFRFGWLDVRQAACDVAVQVGGVLSHRGCPGLRPCSLGCPVGIILIESKRA